MQAKNLGAHEKKKNFLKKIFSKKKFYKKNLYHKKIFEKNFYTQKNITSNIETKWENLSPYQAALTPCDGAERKNEKK